MRPKIDAPAAIENDPEGDYWFVNVSTNDQGPATIYSDKDANLHVRHGAVTKPFAEFDGNAVRWFRIHPIPSAKIAQMLTK